MDSNARLYLGNLPYVAQQVDIENLFSDNDIAIKNIDISIDPFTGRNPSYRFIDFHTADDAQAALTTMQGQRVRGRPIKLTYHTRKKPGQARHDSRYAFNRWKRSDEAPSRWIPPHEEGRRLHVGGLPEIPQQSVVNALMRDLFKDWPVEAVSKIISPHPSTKNKPGEHYYCFVDFPTAEIAQQAAETLNGTKGPDGGTYRISVATQSRPTKVIREQLGGKYSGQIVEPNRSPVRNVGGNWRHVDAEIPEQNVSTALSEAY